MAFNPIKIFIIIFLLLCVNCFILVSSVNAGGAGNNMVLYDWTGETIGNVGLDGQNYNRLKGSDWGLINTSDSRLNQKVLPYSANTSIDHGSNNEVYGVELEFGDVSITPRSIGTKSVRYYVDCGQMLFIARGHSRSEMHIRSVLSDLEVVEGSTLWIGWSEYYTQLDTTRLSTVLQLRNQPSPKLLYKQGIEVLDKEVYTKVINGGPVVAMEISPSVNGADFRFAVRDGSPDKWSLPEHNVHTIKPSISIGIWYDFVIQIKYSRAGNGFFRVWFAPVKTGSSLDFTKPEWTYNGATMYHYPIINGINIKPVPSIRWGVYRYGCLAKNITSECTAITEQNRYMTKYLGPVRMWKGESIEGFSLVKPRD